jgi:MFS family permease
MRFRFLACRCNRSRWLALAYVGLVQIVPVLAFALIAGHVADRFDRRRIVMACLTVVALASAGLGIVSQQGWGERLEWQVAAIYGCLFANGTARAFMQPARASLLPLIVPRDCFPNAVAWNMTIFQIAAVTGPAVGGLLIGMFHSASPAYVLDATAAITFFALLSQIRGVPQATPSESAGIASPTAGIRFVWNNPILLGAMALDLFAVLLGGATILLPVYAKDILEVGPRGLGWMQAAPAAGALGMSFLLAHRPPLKRAGRALLLAVSGFGVATIVFGLSRSFELSLAMLFLTGACDMVSVVVRHTLVQVLTPDEKRGRVSAINGVFIGASNELGGFESGVVAWLFSPQVSVVAGGIGTLVVVLAAAILFPPLRRFGRLDTATPDSSET